MEQLKLIISKEQARLFAQSICYAIKTCCTSNPGEYDTFLEQENYSRQANYIEKNQMRREVKKHAKSK